MTALHFSNRLTEKTWIEDEIARWTGEPQGLCVAAPSGWGKSRLTKHVLEGAWGHNVVIVNTIRSSQSWEKDGAYLHHIARALNDASAKYDDVLSFPSFLEQKEEKFSKSLARSIIEDIFRLFQMKATGKDISEKLVKRPDTRKPTENSQLINDYSHVVALYVHECLSRAKIILNLENIQNIDSSSMETLCDILFYRTPTLLVLEYTVAPESGGWLWHDLASRFQVSGVSIKRLELDPFPEKEIPNALAVTDPLTVSLAMDLYKKDHGNLRQFDDLFAQAEYMSALASGQKNIDTKPTRHNIRALGTGPKHVLSLIATHWGNVEKEVLFSESLYPPDYVDAFNAFDAIEVLKGRKIIDEEPGNYLIQHSEILKELFSDTEFASIRIVAERLWRDFYKKLYDQNKYYVLSGLDVLSRLVFFNFLINDLAATIGLVQEMAAFARRTHRPLKFLEDLRRIREQCNDATRERDTDVVKAIDDALVDIYYASEDAESAFEILATHQISRPRDIAYYAMLLDRTTEHEAAINYCNDCICSEIVEEGSALDLFLKLVMMISLHNIGRHDEKTSLYLKCLNEPKYKEHIQYGYLLRNSQIVFSEEESIPYIQESILFFHDRNLTSHEAYARQALAVKLGNLGKLEDAREQLLQGRRLIQDQVNEYHSLNNNLAVVDILSGILNQDVQYSLQSAYLMAKIPFSRLVIATNMIVFFSLRGEPDKIEPLLHSIYHYENIGKPVDLSTWRLVYYNISTHFGRIGNSEKSDFFMEKAKSVPGALNSFWRYKFYGNGQDGDLPFMARQVFRPIFLTHWFLFVDSSL